MQKIQKNVDFLRYALKVRTKLSFFSLKLKTDNL
jgi:hypothetical protein